MIFKKISLALLPFFVACFFINENGFAQNYHFVYLQSANRQPYTVQLNEQNYASTVGGYMIIPRLMPGNHQIQLQWQQNPSLILNFNIPVTDQDAGYNLSKGENGNWQLTGLSNELVIAATMPSNSESSTVAQTTQIQNNNIADSSTNNKSASNKAASNTATTVKPLKANTAEANSTNSSTVSNTNDVSIKKQVMPKQVTRATNNGNVAKTFERMGAEGLDQIYVVQGVSKSDTIAVFIPLKQAPKAEVKPAEVPATPQMPKEVVTTVATNKIDSSSNLNATNNDNQNTTSKPNIDNTIQKNNAQTCQPATKEDFNATRIAMASSYTDAAMIDAAKKAFEKNCYSVDQIKNLGVLFLSQQNRLQFFIAARPHLLDAANFGSLVNEFIDPNVIDQFKKLDNSN
ncbi:DUF4476 domain-containing protein [Hydrotalea sp.]|uniref:DUF4476 domain-containing protein n=1 Tax=Hydrotalea sp. TaxID=2881279 RepID=UPI003D109EC3